MSGIRSLGKPDSLQVIDITLDHELSEGNLGEAAYWIHFSSPQIVKFFIEPSERRSVRVWLPGDADTGQIKRKVKDTLAFLLLSGTNGTRSMDDGDPPPARVGAHDIQTSMVNFTPDDAIDVGLIKPLGVADVIIRSPMVELIRALDVAFRSIAARFEAAENAYSALLPIDFLQECRYFDAFPQNIMFATHLNADIDAARRFVNRTLADDGRPPRDFEGFADRTHVLAPAACFHVYHGMREEQLLRNTAITTASRCFRYESRNARLVERLWDFTMREVVFIGEPDYVRDCRERSRAMVLELVDKWELSGVVELGHDPFFMRGHRDDFVGEQNSKFELRLDLPYRKADLACASFNVCGTFFGSVSKIHAPNGEVAWSGCTAFGLERWAWAVVTQHGINLDKWPLELRSLVKGNS